MADRIRRPPRCHECSAPEPLMFERTPGWPPLQLEARRPAVATSMVKRLASIEYAIAMVHGVRGVTQTALATRYGVAPATISNRYAEIRSALALVPGDPRYCAVS